MARFVEMRYAAAMSALPKDRITVEEYLAWSEGQEGRYELVDGLIYAQAAERAAHAEMKGHVFLALVSAIRKSGSSCHALVDGMAVRIGARTVFEPDAMVYCGPKLPPDALLLENPIIVVEIISPTTGRNDRTRKLAGYFNLPSIRHYLIVDPDDTLVVHHERGENGVVRTHVITDGAVKLNPPGLEFTLSELYASA